jgi:predicted nucleic acid-binding protein
MGLILDSSILIAGERRGESVREILKRVQAKHGETESGLSAVTIVELTHGIYRAKSERTANDGEHLPKNCVGIWQSIR